MLVYLLAIVLTVSGATPKEKHPKWTAHPQIECNTVVLVSTKSHSVSSHKLSYQKPFAKEPESALGTLSTKPGITTIITDEKDKALFGINFSLASQTKDSVAINTQLFNNTQVAQLAVSIFSFVKQSFNFVAIASVEHHKMANLSSGVGYRTDTQVVPLLIKDPIGMPDLHVIPFLKGMRLDKHEKFDFCVGVRLITYNETHYNSVVSLCGAVTSDFVSYYRIEYMPTKFDDGSFFESTYYASTRGITSLDTAQAHQNNFHAGVSSFTIQEQVTFDFVYPGHLGDESHFIKSINVSIFSHRKFHSCPEGKFLNDTSKLCEMTCAKGYVGDKFSGNCMKCHSSCLSCISAAIDGCISCVNNKTLIAGRCGCGDGYYEAAKAVGCLPCNKQCKTCEVSSGQCTSCFKGAGVQDSKCVCKQGSNRYMVNGQCQCKKGYTENSKGNCEECSSLLRNCLECSSSQLCTKCLLPQLVIENGVCGCSLYSKKQIIDGKCQCPQGSVQLNSRCQSCDEAIVGCSQCSSNSSCLKCSAPMQLVQGKCKCPTNHSLVSGKCVMCPKGCADCDSNGKCLQCLQQLKLTINSTCQCQSGKIFDLGKCRQCSAVMEGCLTCSSTLQCNTCTQGYGIQDNTCAKCNEIVEDCVKCSSDGTCLECNATKHMTVIDGECGCEAAYFDSATGCRQCSSKMPGCLQCSSSTVCTKCAELDGVSLDEQTDKCLCDNGGSIDPESNKCSFRVSADGANNESDTFKIVLRTAVVIGVVLAALGLFYQPYIGSQAIFLLQLAYFAPAVLSESLFSMTVVTKFSAISRIVNGFNGLEFEGIDGIELPQRYSQMGYQANFVENLNIMLFIQIAILILAVLIRMMAQGSMRLYKISYGLIKMAQYFVAFNALNVGFSLVTNLRFGSDSALLFANISLGLAALGMVLYHNVNNYIHFDQLDVRDTVFNPNKRSKRFWPVFVLFKFGIGLMLGYVDSNLAAIIVVVAQLILTIGSVLNPPYISNMKNVMLIFNEFTSAFLLSSFCAYRLELTDSLVLTYISGGLLLIGMLLSIAVLLYAIFGFTRKIFLRDTQAFTEQLEQNDKGLSTGQSVASIQGQFDSNVKFAI